MEIGTRERVCALMRVHVCWGIKEPHVRLSPTKGKASEKALKREAVQCIRENEQASRQICSSGF